MLFSWYMKKDTYIYIHLIGEAEKLIDLRAVEENIKKDFGYLTKTSRSKINPEDFYDPARKQYHSTKILKEMLDELPPMPQR